MQYNVSRFGGYPILSAAVEIIVEVTRRRLEAAINAFERAVPFAILQSPNLSKIKRGAEFCCISPNQ
jgi:hypothetical protein